VFRGGYRVFRDHIKLLCGIIPAQWIRLSIGSCRCPRCTRRGTVRAKFARTIQVDNVLPPHRYARSRRRPGNLHPGCARGQDCMDEVLILQRIHARAVSTLLHLQVDSVVCFCVEWFLAISIMHLHPTIV